MPVAAKLITEPVSIFETVRTARRNVLELIPEAALSERIISGRTLIQRWHMIMDPAAIRRVLVDAVDAYPKSEATKSVLRPATGDSILVAEGAEWRWQRRAAAPAFSPRNVAGLTPIMSAAADAAIARIDAARGRAVDMMDEMMQATFQVISDVTFSGEGGVARAAVQGALDAYLAGAGRVSWLDLMGAPAWVPRPDRVAAQRTMADFGTSNDAIIADRRQGPRRTDDLLGLLLGAEDPKTGRRMQDAELRNNLMTFVVAGHETTALTLAWALYLLANHPDIQGRARAEAQEVLGDRTAEAADVERLTFVRQVVEETLRLYPAAGFLSRTAQAHDQLCGHDVRPGDTVTIPVYAVHRHRKLWQDPGAFRPERFGDRKAIDRFTYLPFGDGPRVCIGARFAMQEAIVILASLLARYSFTPVTGRDPAPVMVLTLRPQGGVWLEAAPL